MDKPNKTDNAEQPAETADTEGGLTAEKPRSRRKKTSIAHIATVCGSVYTGGKTAKDIKKQAEQSAITADDAEIIEIPEPVELYETDCLREPEDSEDASPYDPLSAVCLNGRRSVEELMETGNLSDIDRLRGIVVCEERPLNKKREYANRLTELLSCDIESVIEESSRIKPILGKVKAGYDMYADEDVEGYIELGQADSKRGDYFLRVKGDSMEGSHIYDGDLIYVRCQSEVQSGSIAVVMIGDEVTVKKVKYKNDLMILEASNPKYEARYFTAEEIIDQQVKVIGLVRFVRTDFA